MMLRKAISLLVFVPALAMGGATDQIAGAAVAQAVHEVVSGGEGPTKEKKAPKAPVRPARPSPIKPHPMPYDPSLVVFPYDPNYTYPILTRLEAFTHIRLAEGEKVTGFYVSDTLRWPSKVAATKQDIFIKPTAEDIETVATLITNKRRYELSFMAVSAAAGCTPSPSSSGCTWYQRVSWDTDESFEQTAEPESEPTRVSRRTGIPARPALEPAVPAPGNDNEASLLPAFRAAGTDRSSAPTVRLDKLNFAYGIEGNAPFKPTMVFDDGRFTWIKMPRVQRLPVLFVVEASGDGVPTNFIPPQFGESDYFQVPRVLAHGAILKLGPEEVRIKNLKENCGGLFQPSCPPFGTNLIR